MARKFTTPYRLLAILLYSPPGVVQRYSAPEGKLRVETRMSRLVLQLRAPGYRLSKYLAHLVEIGCLEEAHYEPGGRVWALINPPNPNME
jgi:hypothetical protein